MMLNKTFSKSLKNIINNTNPEQKQVTMYFERSASAQRNHEPTLPSLSIDTLHTQKRAKSRLQKVKTEPAEEEEPNIQQKIERLYSLEKGKNQQGRRKQSDLSQQIDGLMYKMIEKGQADVKGSRKQLENIGKRKLKNLRIVTQPEQERINRYKFQPRGQTKLEILLMNRQIQIQQNNRKKFNDLHPYIQGKVASRDKSNKRLGISKQILSYYPLKDIREQKQAMIMKMAQNSQDCFRQMRQGVFTRTHISKRY